MMENRKYSIRGESKESIKKRTMKIKCKNNSDIHVLLQLALGIEFSFLKVQYF